MHKIEQHIHKFLESIDTLNPKEVDHLVVEFGKNCEKALRECLLVKRSEEPFVLRMSNIGKPLRQLLLEKIHGRPPMDSQQRLRMTYGYIWESFILFLLKASGLPVKESGKVALDIAYDTDKKLTLKGTYDLKIDGELYDIKSASSWSYDNKFTSFNDMEKDDPFGYCGQALAYSLADKSHFAGWIVCDKSDGRIKVVEIPKANYRDIARKYLDDFKHKIRELLSDKPNIPPCTGVVKETFRTKPTGKCHLSKSCEFCSHKYKCHPTLVYAPNEASSAKQKEYKYYIGTTDES